MNGVIEKISDQTLVELFVMLTSLIELRNMIENRIDEVRIKVELLGEQIERANGSEKE